MYAYFLRAIKVLKFRLPVERRVFLILLLSRQFLWFFPFLNKA